MRREQLQAIADRAAAATPGPWLVGTDHPTHGDVLHEHEVIISDGHPILELEPGKNGAADADFIAHARHDVEALLAEVARLQALVDDDSVLVAFRASLARGMRWERGAVARALHRLNSETRR